MRVLKEIILTTISQLQTTNFLNSSVKPVHRRKKIQLDHCQLKKFWMRTQIKNLKLRVHSKIVDYHHHLRLLRRRLSSRAFVKKRQRRVMHLLKVKKMLYCTKTSLIKKKMNLNNAWKSLLPSYHLKVWNMSTRNSWLKRPIAQVFRKNILV